MKAGVIFPQTEVETDPETARSFVEAAEDVGYTHLQAYDHVLGVDTSSRPEYSGYFDYTDSFHEPFTFFSHLAAITDDIRFVTGILILPQRQTALVAKQSAEVDVLSEGRLTLGVGVGWNEAEYRTLNEDFETRGRRIEEQIEVLEELWMNRSVEFSGEWHDIPALGINPLPVQQPIPIWMGGSAKSVRERTARLSDGWLVPKAWKDPDSDLSTFEAALEDVYSGLEDAGRDPTDFDVVGRTWVRSDDPDDWVERALDWKRAGATHLALTTMESGLDDIEDHVDLIQRWKMALDDAGVTS